jgi:hypothetical protein
MKLHEKECSISLRRRGWSVGEIAAKLKVSKSSVSVWVRDVSLTTEAQKIITDKLSAGQKRASEVLRERTRFRENQAHLYAKDILDSVFPITTHMRTLLLATYYWCEGNKSPKDLVLFTNSDPGVIRAFVSLLRSTFEIQEEKFRVCVHLHEYHAVEQELTFWSQITNIPRKKFMKPYIKPHTAKRVHDGYRGCAQVRYYDITIARKLLALGRRLTEQLGNTV